MANIYHLAKEAGVSTATISRVLNNKPGVAKETRERVLKAIRGSNFQPKLIRNRSDTIGVIYHWLSRPLSNDYYMAEILSGIIDTAALNNFNVLLLPDSFHGIEDLGTYLRQRHIQGIIQVAPAKNDPWVRKIIASSFTHIIVGSRWNDKCVNWVDSDNIKGTREAIQYLINSGHRRIGFIGGILDLSNHADRLLGYKIALRENSISVEKELISLIYDEVDFVNGEGGRQAMLRLLSHPNPPTAVFISSGHCIIGAMSAIGEKGLKIPDNISLVGYDDIPLASYISPPLTTVRQPIYKLGKRGAEELFNLINVGGHKENKIEIILNSQLIIRQSVKPFR